MMKQMKRLIAIMLACILALGAMASCGGDPEATDTTVTTEDNRAEMLLEKNGNERAMAFYQYVDEAMEQCGSYTMKGNGKFAGKMLGHDVEATFDMLEKLVGNSASMQASYRKISTVVKMDGTKINETDSIKGYYDGKMFIATNTNGTFNGVYSSTPVADYIALQKEQTDDTNFDISDSTDMTCVQNADGSWIATYKGFSSLDTFEELTSGMDAMLEEGVTFSDVEATIDADANFILKSMKLKLLFAIAPDVEAEAPVFEITYQVKDVGTTQAEVVDFGTYNEVADLIAAFEVEKAFADFLKSPSARYVADIRNRTKVGTSSENTSESDHVSFQIADGKISFVIRARIPSIYYTPSGPLVVPGSQEQQEYYLRYSDGKLVTEVMKNDLVDQSYSQDATDSEARSFLASNFNPASFSADNISAMEKVEGENGEICYKFTIADPYDPNYGEDYTLRSSTATLDVTMKNGKIVKSYYQYTATLLYRNITVTSSVTSEVTVQ